MRISAEQKKFVDLMVNPESVLQFGPKQWEQLLRILRGADMLGTYYYLLQRHQLLKDVPDFALAHLVSARRYADRQVQQINNEADYISQALSVRGCQAIFLKGAAYVLKGSTNHFGRVMNDIDVLVPIEKLAEAERALKQDGWLEKKLDDYDEQYYRKWAHELPPFSHPERGATLDLHHTIIPPISGILIPAEILFSQVQKTVSNHLTLSDEMIIIHCIVHLFYNEEYEKSFRDILDVHLLLQDYEQQNSLAQVSTLVSQLGFDKEWYYALRLTDSLFNTSRVDTLSAQKALNRYPASSNAFIQYIILPALMPSHDLLDRRWNRFSRFVMFLRGHLLKMPLRILIPHFLVKSGRAMVMMVMGSHYYEK